jgi:hypothetical protein
MKSQGWLGVKNGRLLDLIEQAAFDAFLTNDKRMENEQNLVERSFAVLVLSTDHWETLEPHVPEIVSAIDWCQPGTVSKIDCSKSVPRKFRKPKGPAVYIGLLRLS